jgi:hypothetical protein
MLLVCGLVALVVGDRTVAADPPFVGSIAPLSAKQRTLMTGISWRPGCPVPLRDLRMLTVSHWGFDGGRRTGRLVVHETAASPLRTVFRRPYAARFPVRKIFPIDVNPIENPYSENGRVYHDASRSYVSRQPVRKGTAADGGALVRAFHAIGWGWGGRWTGSAKDYRHFSASGR